MTTPTAIPVRPTIDPPIAKFDVRTKNDTVVHQVGNPTDERIAIKVKTSDNALYKVSPVYAFIDPGTAVPVEVMRLVGAPKVDRMCVQYAPAPANLATPREAFVFGELPVKLIAT